MGYSFTRCGSFDTSDAFHISSFDTSIFDVGSLIASDGVVFSDSLSKGMSGSLSDGVIFADSLSTYVGFYRTLSDGVIFADSIDKTWNAYRNLSDGAVFSDSYTRVWNAYRTFSDGVRISEVMSASFLAFHGDWASTVVWNKSATALGENPDNPASAFWGKAAADRGIWTKAMADNPFWTKQSTSNPKWAK